MHVSIPYTRQFPVPERTRPGTCVNQAALPGVKLSGIGCTRRLSQKPSPDYRSIWYDAHQRNPMWVARAAATARHFDIRGRGGLACSRSPPRLRSLEHGMATPWFPMYPTDFLVSTATMTAVQGWAYTQLLMYAWTNHGVPDDREACATLTRCNLSEADWAVIRQRFTRMAGPMATLSNPRMERERARVEEKHATASENGRRGADARWRARNGVANGNANGGANGGANGNANGETMATTTTTTTTDIQPPIAPPSKGGRVGKNRRDRNKDLNQPQW